MAARFARSRIALIMLVLVASLIPVPSPSSSATGIPVTQAPYPHYYAHILQSRLHPAEFHQFIQRVNNGDRRTITGVYAPNTLALPVVQQPAGQDVYVSDTPDVLTQFRLASQYGSVGIFAHNSLAGANFFRLGLGQQVSLVNGDGSVRDYRISTIRRFQALQPDSPYSNFIDLDQPQQQLTSGDLFKQIYTKAGQVVFQTCIAKDGNDSWGRIFIIATPLVPLAGFGWLPVG